jgi:hypothetical protein
VPPTTIRDGVALRVEDTVRVIRVLAAVDQLRAILEAAPDIEVVQAAGPACDGGFGTRRSV